MDYLKDLKALQDGAVPPLGERGGPAEAGIVRDIIPPAPRRRLPARIHRGRKRAAPPAAPVPSTVEKRPAFAVLQTPPADAEEAGPIPVRTWEPDANRWRRIRRTIALCTLGLIAALALVLPTFAFPSYVITLYPVRSSAPIEAAITADAERADPDPGARRIPALLVGTSATMTKEYEASGKKFVTTRSEGRVLLFNAYSSSPQTLVSSTRLQAPSGKIYRLRDTLTVPGAKVEAGQIVPTSIAAVAIADEPGEAYNIGPTEFRIPGFRGSPKYQGFSAKAEQGFSGGFVGEARIVTEEDLRRASEDLTREIVAKLSGELKTKSPPAEDFLVPDGGREVVIVSIESPKAGERHERYPVTVSARGRLMALSRFQLAETLAAIAALPPAPGLTLKFPPAQPELAIRDARFKSGAGELTFTASGKLHYYEEPDLPGLAAVLRASTPEKAEAYLASRREIESFRIKRFPAWLWFIPQRPGGLRIEIEPPA